MKAAGNHSGFEANRAAFAALLRGDQDRAARLLETGEAQSFASFVTANKLEFHLESLPPGSAVRRQIDPFVLQLIADHCAAQRERQNLLLDELWSLADILEGSGVGFMLLKGLYFADCFYGGVENRFSWDLDVLVRQPDAARVDRLLRRSGYFRRSAVLFSRALTARFTHAFDYGNERPRFSVDLHWMLSRHPSFAVDEDSIWNGRGRYVLSGREFEVLSLEFEVVSNALSTFRDIQRGAIRIRAFVDLFRVLEKADATIDWDGFMVRRRREKTLSVVVNVLSMLFDLLECADRFPGASAMVEREDGRLVALPSCGTTGLFETGRAALPNRAWTSSVYECSQTSVASWWLVSLPFRMAVYKSGRRYANFKRRIHTMKRRINGHLSGTPSTLRRPQS